ncbi:hypothetical protein [Xanthobacter sp. VNH20]|uniref:hypothetical protein n=1 Tax=Xanthobacter sp. VNH20 TaxID=3156616 RepID=UPI0032B3AD00
MPKPPALAPAISTSTRVAVAPVTMAFGSSGDLLPNPPSLPLRRRLDWLSETVRLDERDRSILGLVARVCAVREVNELYSALTHDFARDHFGGELRPDLDLRHLSRLGASPCHSRFQASL